LAGHADDAVVRAAGLDNFLYVLPDFLGPLFLGAKSESPSLLAAVGLADIDARDFIGDGIGFRVGLAIPASLRACLRAEIWADGPFTELANEEFKLVCLIATSTDYR
jgi:hypothetical protein